MDDTYVERFRALVAEKEISCSIHVFDTSCHSVAEACRATGAKSEDFVKSVCLKGDGDFIVAIIGGNFRVSTKRVAKGLGIKVPRIATPEEVLLHTGFPIGGVPPVGYEATFCIDDKVLEKEFVWAGGGSGSALVRIAPSEIISCTGAAVMRLRK